MHIVLTGATGFVGSHLVPSLSSKGHTQTVLCRDRQRCRAMCLAPRVQLRLTRLDSEPELSDALQGADAVINAVGILNESGRDGSGFDAAHVGTVRQLLAACKTTGVRRFIQISALNAGEGKSHYLRSKGEAERLLLDCPDVDATILRPSVIFGDGDSFFNRFAQLLQILPLMPLACPAARLQPVWIGDVCAAVAAVLERPATAGQVLDLVGPKIYTLRQLVELTANIKGWRRKVIGLPDALARVQAAAMDFVPGKPFSTDNYLSLQLDSVSQKNALPGLGIRPRSIPSVVPSYLTTSPHQRRLDRGRTRPRSAVPTDSSGRHA